CAERGADDWARRNQLAATEWNPIAYGRDGGNDETAARLAAGGGPGTGAAGGKGIIAHAGRGDRSRPGRLSQTAGKFRCDTACEQVPEIFMHSVPASDTAVVQLPYDKVIEELSNLRVRHDQTEEQIVAQYQTPFLQVTVEESERFGTKMEPVQVTEFPRVRIGVEPATAEAIAAAEPEATATEKFTPSHFERTTPPDVGRSKRSAPPLEFPTAAPLSKSESAEPAESRAEPATPEKSAESRIPFSLKPVTPEKRVVVEHVPEGSLPNGTGEPALPRVPASSGSPVPPSAPPPPSPPAPPTRIPFKLSPIPAPKPESTPTVREGVGKFLVSAATDDGLFPLRSHRAAVG
ncbi:MAG: hypothetical protein DMF03_02045, partial [Verrucomicrobia bacterium]